ncbi:hypothetical protein ASG81_23635 [Paenibacillus sp. Soil522]|nr:hypothetical protein ASG81_23635 [Paenibacillus sp. Soil522]
MLYPIQYRDTYVRAATENSSFLLQMCRIEQKLGIIKAKFLQMCRIVEKVRAAPPKQGSHLLVIVTK